ncbi:hypothetical protein JCM12178A_10670 [Salidesulfovibrio brasiliensis]
MTVPAEAEDRVRGVVTVPAVVAVRDRAKVRVRDADRDRPKAADSACVVATDPA